MSETELTFTRVTEFESAGSIAPNNYAVVSQPLVDKKARISTIINSMDYSYSLSGLADVDLSGVSNNDILTVSGNVFRPFDLTTIESVGAHNLESPIHTNVLSAGLSDGDTLQYNGTNWVPVSVDELYGAGKTFTIKEISGNYTPILDDFDNTILMTTQTSTTVTLPTISNMNSEYGHVLRICKNMSVLTASSLIINAPTGYAIETGTTTTSSTFTSGTSPNIYNYNKYVTGQLVNNYSAEPFANVSLQLNNGTKWTVMGGHGTWDRKVRTVLYRQKQSTTVPNPNPREFFSDTTTFERL